MKDTFLNRPFVAVTRSDDEYFAQNQGKYMHLMHAIDRVYPGADASEKKMIIDRAIYVLSVLRLSEMTGYESFEGTIILPADYETISGVAEAIDVPLYVTQAAGQDNRLVYDYARASDYPIRPVKSREQWFYFMSVIQAVAIQQLGRARVDDVASLSPIMLRVADPESIVLDIKQGNPVAFAVYLKPLMSLAVNYSPKDADYHMLGVATPRVTLAGTYPPALTDKVATILKILLHTAN